MDLKQAFETKQRLFFWNLSRLVHLDARALIVVLLCFYWFGQYLCFKSARVSLGLIYVLLEVGSGGAVIMIVWAIPYFHKQFFQILKRLGFSNSEIYKVLPRYPEQIVHLVSVFIFFVYYTIIVPALIGLPPLSHWIFYLAGASSLVLNAVMSLIGSIIASDFLVEIISIMYFTRRISNKVTIDVLDPDKCGGLKDIGSFFLTLDTFYFLLLSFSLLWITAQVKINTNSIIGGSVNSVGIILFGIGLFLFPQWEIHKRMKESKKDFLGKVVEKVNSRGGKPEKPLVKIYYLILHDRVEKMNEFPFDASAIWKLSTLFSLPIFSFVVRIILSALGISMSA